MVIQKSFNGLEAGNFLFQQSLTSDAWQASEEASVILTFHH